MRFAPDDLSPAVDEAKLKRYLRHELSEDESELVSGLIGTFKPWYDACSAIVRVGAY
jgi:hypothetical protein